MHTLAYFFRKILDFLFPPHCLGCGASGTFFCEECIAKIHPLTHQTCPVCKRISQSGKTHPTCQHQTPLSALLVCAHYEENPILQKAITHLKYHNRENLAPTLGPLLRKTLTNNLSTQNTIVIPVPLHWRRQLRRGYNQSLLLAQTLNLPICEILKRTRYTPSQVEVASRTKRIANLRGAFTCTSTKLDPKKTYLLIDDVSSTRTTLDECAHALHEAGARKIFAIVLARN